MDKLSHISDEQLLALYYKKHDRALLGMLLERYTVLLLGVCMKYLKQKEDAHDAVQQVFLKTLSAAPKTRIENMGAWLYQVARNECYTRLREQGKRAVETTASSSELPAEEPISITDWMTEEKKFAALEKAVSELKAYQKACITQFYLEEKSYKVIAESLDLSVKEVKSHIQNGKRNLKIRLNELIYLSEKGANNA